jgi:hypothetical protein
VCDIGGTRCVVDGCEQESDGPPVTFNEATVRLYPDHRSDFDIDSDEWNGELSGRHEGRTVMQTRSHRLRVLTRQPYGRQVKGCRAGW